MIFLVITTTDGLLYVKGAAKSALAAETQALAIPNGMVLPCKANLPLYAEDQPCNWQQAYKPTPLDTSRNPW